MLNVRQSYVFAQQQGLLNRIGNFFSGNPNSQQQVYIVAQQKIEAAARHSPLLAQAQHNTVGMLTGMLHSLGFQRVNGHVQLATAADHGDGQLATRFSSALATGPALLAPKPPPSTSTAKARSPR